MRWIVLDAADGSVSARASSSGIESPQFIHATYSSSSPTRGHCSTAGAAVEDLVGTFSVEARPPHGVEPVLLPADVGGGMGGRAQGRDRLACEARADLVLRPFNAVVEHGVGNGAVERQHVVTYWGALKCCESKRPTQPSSS